MVGFLLPSFASVEPKLKSVVKVSLTLCEEYTFSFAFELKSNIMDVWS